MLQVARGKLALVLQVARGKLASVEGGAGDAVPEQGEEDAVHVQPLTEVADVGADGGLGEVEARRDFAVAAAVAKGGEDVDLARAEEEAVAQKYAAALDPAHGDEVVGAR